MGHIFRTGVKSGRKHTPIRAYVFLDIGRLQTVFLVKATSITFQISYGFSKYDSFRTDRMMHYMVCLHIIYGFRELAGDLVDDFRRHLSFSISLRRESP